jgi:SAM-dependent methyltransferase
MTTTALVEGARWSARAADWAELAAPISAPAWIAIADRLGIGDGMRVLDVACGSGEFCRLAAARGAAVCGIDAAEALVEIARGRLPHADLRVGAMESLPWPEESFDAVTGFNAFQFAADFAAALAEAARVTRHGGRVAICNWGRPEESELFAVVRPLRALQPPRPEAPRPPDIGAPGVLEALAGRAGLRPVASGEVDVPFECRDQETFDRALLASGGATLAIEHSGELAVLTALHDAAAPFRRPDGSYRLENRFRYVISWPGCRWP